MDTLFISEEFINPFKFLHDGSVCIGMNFRTLLFAQVLAAPLREREQFFKAVDRMRCESADMVITASKYRYTAWIDLRSGAAGHLLAEQQALAVNPLTPV